MSFEMGPAGFVPPPIGFAPPWATFSSFTVSEPSAVGTKDDDQGFVLGEVTVTVTAVVPRATECGPAPEPTFFPSTSTIASFGAPVSERETVAGAFVGSSEGSADGAAEAGVDGAALATSP